MNGALHKHTKGAFVHSNNERRKVFKVQLGGKCVVLSGKQANSNQIQSNSITLKIFYRVAFRSEKSKKGQSVKQTCWRL